MGRYRYIPHRRIAQRKDERPPKVADEHVGPNGRLAATLTKRLGSMWVVYAVSLFTLTWIALAEIGPLKSFDPYPFGFLLFLGNVIQVLLIFVIMVGQQVLGAAADKRAAQTYHDTEAILHELGALREHLAKQGELMVEVEARLLPPGSSQPAESSQPAASGLLGPATGPDPVQLARSGPAPKVADAHVGVNGRIAAFLTQKVGTMWAFYFSTIVIVGWITLSIVGILTFDPYPFAFLLFVTSLVQLILMFVIMVGQDVLGIAADRRASDTYEDAEAILAKMQPIHDHLDAEDAILERLGATGG